MIFTSNLRSLFTEMKSLFLSIIFVTGLMASELNFEAMAAVAKSVNAKVLRVENQLPSKARDLSAEVPSKSTKVGECKSES